MVAPGRAGGRSSPAWFLLALSTTLVGYDCDPPPEPPRPRLDGISRRWEFRQMTRGATGEELIGGERFQVGGVVDETLDLGPLPLFPDGEGPDAEASVFSSEGGSTWWVSAEAPHEQAPGVGPYGSSAWLTQHQEFRKVRPDATLRVVVTKAVLEAIDGNADLPSQEECPWRAPGEGYERCLRVMWPHVSFGVKAFAYRDQRIILKTGGSAELSGWRSFWSYDAYTDNDATIPFWRPESFELEADVGSTGTGGHARLALAAPITIDVPLDSVRVGDAFFLSVHAGAWAGNRRQRESYAASFFRDPSALDGLAFAYDGLLALEAPQEEPVDTLPQAAPECAGAPDPAAGTLSFAAAAFGAPEMLGGGVPVKVTRSGGGSGAVSVRIATADGTALAGGDYGAVDTLVLFADGEEGSRVVTVPLVEDREIEPDETVTVALSDPRGCAAVGAPSTAVLTILDDDRPPDLPPTYTVGGAVTGLAGDGLVLREVVSGFAVTPASDGPFTFGVGLRDGGAYDVRVESQPTSPIQVCAVANGAGVVAGADVVDVAVTCETPLPTGALDPAFAAGGLQTTGLPVAADALALQPDGKIVVAGGLRIARYGSDGASDPTFGAGGTASVAFGGDLLDRIRAIAVQPDGRIVVAGHARVGTSDDFAVARLLADGSPDASFGAGGWTSTDFAGSVDRAVAVRVQGDGSIVVAGHAATPSASGVDSDFAVARYTSAGVLDAAFGAGGKVTANVAGLADLASALVVQPDGRVVLAGRVAASGAEDPDVGLVRLEASGALDAGFGAGGAVRLDLSGGSWDEASGLALQPDGALVVAVQASLGGLFQFGAARLDATGGLDAAFGANGLATASFGAENDHVHALAVQADGKIVLAGQASNLGNPDLGVARLDASGALDATFGDGGRVSVDFFGSTDGAQAVALQPDGKILVAGLARNGTTNGLGLARLLP